MWKESTRRCRGTQRGRSAGSEGIRETGALQEMSRLRAAGRPKGGQCKAPSTRHLRSSRVPCPCVHRSALLPPPFLHLSNSAPRPVSPCYFGQGGPHAQSLPLHPPVFRVAPAGNELAPPPCPSLLSAAPSPSSPMVPGARSTGSCVL